MRLEHRSRGIWGSWERALVGYGGLEDGSDDSTVAEAMRTEVR